MSWIIREMYLFHISLTLHHLKAGLWFLSSKGWLMATPARSTKASSTSQVVTTTRSVRTARMSWVMTRHGTVRFGCNASPWPSPAAGTAWPPSTTSSTPSEAATITRTPPSASTSCTWSPTTRGATSGLMWHRCCCPTARRGWRSGWGKFTCSAATAGRAWRSLESPRYMTPRKGHGPEGRTCPNASRGRRRAFAPWSPRLSQLRQRKGNWCMWWTEDYSPRSRKNSDLLTFRSSGCPR